MLMTLNRYAVAIAMIVLGLSGCSSPQESVVDSASVEDSSSIKGSSHPD